jgi:pSer/pThr/pTyr-binding forkhead associated (FHA) protein
MNGTFVNGRLIGCRPNVTAGWLLNDGDIIEIRPYMRLYFHQKLSRGGRSPLTELQRKEIEVCLDEGLLTEPH